MITIIDYGMGNVGSIRNMFKKIGHPAKISSSPDDILSATRLILPGVGAFDTGMTRLRDSGLLDLLNRRVLQEGVPVLGVCLGMQLLGRGSEEGKLPGLGWIRADSLRLDGGIPPDTVKIPHMGWNTISVKREGSLFAGLSADARFYFVHSYHVRCDDSADILATSMHGGEFVAALQHDNVMGTQFHPEKSHRFGMAVLNRFAGAC